MCVREKGAIRPRTGLFRDSTAARRRSVAMDRRRAAAPAPDERTSVTCSEVHFHIRRRGSSCHAIAIAGSELLVLTGVSLRIFRVRTISDPTSAVAPAIINPAGSDPV
jgi:hypothetical protein